MLTLVAGESEIAAARKTSLFHPHGVVAEGNEINGGQQLRGQKVVQMLRQIAPANILHFADVGLQDKILGISGKLPELLQGGRLEGRLLDSGKEVTVLRGNNAVADRFGFLQRQPHMMAFLLAEPNNLAIQVGQHRQGGRLHPPHIQGVVVEDGEQVACIDADEPIRLLAAECRLR